MAAPQAGTDAPRPALTFFLDVDNTLLDNDRLKSDIGTRVEQLVGPEEARRFWSVYEEVRTLEEYVDYPTTIQRFAASSVDPTLADRLSRMLEGIEFPSYLYPGALDAIAHLKRFGPVAILSDGDQVFQPLKIERSGLQAAVDGHVLIYVHKEDELPQVYAAYPAEHYVMVDDKPRILAALEECCPTTFTTVQVLQGHYATQREDDAKPDYVIPRIGDLVDFSENKFLTNGSF